MDHHVDLYGGYASTIAAVSYSFAAVSSVLLIMRIYVVAFIGSSQDRWPLYWAIIAWAMALVETVINSVALDTGLGNHLSIIQEAGAIKGFLYWSWLSVFFFTCNLGLGKIQAVSFLLALHADSHPKRRYLLHFIWASNIIFGIPSIFIQWFRCNPPSVLFDPLQQAHCDPTRLIHYAWFLLPYSAISDLTLSLLPIFLVWPLQMKMRLKLIVCFLMGLGVLAAVGSVMVARYVYTLRSPDVSYDVSVLFLWGKATCWLVIISSSVPPVWPLVKHVRDRVTSRGSTPPGATPRTSAPSKRSSFIRLEEGNASRDAPQPWNRPAKMEIGKQVEVSQYEERGGESSGTLRDVQRAYYGYNKGNGQGYGHERGQMI